MTARTAPRTRTSWPEPVSWLLATVLVPATLVAGLDAVERVEVLPFHELGAPMYAALEIPFPLEDVPTPDHALVDRVRDQFASHGLTTP